MATGGEAKGEGEAGEGGREGGGEGVQEMERDNALSHDCIVPLPSLTLEVTFISTMSNFFLLLLLCLSAQFMLISALYAYQPKYKNSAVYA